MSEVPRLIAHLDMDAFYASVALLRYPELRGRAVVIGGGSRSQPVEQTDAATGAKVRRFAVLRDYTGRGVVMTATYEARALGLHSAQGLMKAAQIAPDAILVPTDFDAYRKHSRLFKAAVRTLATRVEDRGIDEIYIDLTGIEAPHHGLSVREPSPDAWLRARAVAQSIKEAVRAATGLSCSIGVAPNKLLAKIASDLDKPDGLTLLRPADIPGRIWPLPARRVNGIGPKSSARLEALGIRTIGELAQADPAWLIEHFGSNYGAWLHNAAHGRDERPVVTYSEPKSISRETTFEHDLSATGAPARTVRVPVLTWHRVAPLRPGANSIETDLTVEPATFSASIRALAAAGYSSVSQDELYDALWKGARLPAKPVLLTVDDGYVDDVKRILPALRRARMVASFFVITGRMREAGFLTATQIRALDRAGMDVGDHTAGHVDLTTLPAAEVAAQTAGSRRTLERVLGHRVYSFAYPFGANDAATRAAVARAGYTFAFTTAYGTRLRTAERLALPRLHVGRATSPQAVVALASS